jgi:predicted Zn-dependent peptidase
MGIWVKVGSRYEFPTEAGISHFLEHMLFKGTERRSAEDIAMETDSLGGELNALTSTEYTLYYIKVLDEYMENAVDLLSDIFLNSKIPATDIEKEKSIISEEIKMVEDTPSDYIHDLFSRNVWGEHGLGQTVLGSEETIGQITREKLLSHVDTHYKRSNIIVACSGNFREEELVASINETIGNLQRNAELNSITAPEFHSPVNIITKDLSEAHLCLGLPGLPYNSEKRYTAHLLNAILGSGYSSRLFQKVREKRGLAYSIYSYHSSFADTGLWFVYAGTDRRNVNEVIKITADEFRNLSRTINQDDLKRSKAQLKGNLILALESTSNKMTNIAKQEIYYGRYYSPSEIIDKVEAITIDDLRDLAVHLCENIPFALTVYGPVKEGDVKDSLGHVS